VDTLEQWAMVICEKSERFRTWMWFVDSLRLLSLCDGFGGLMDLWDDFVGLTRRQSDLPFEFWLICTGCAL